MAAGPVFTIGHSTHPFDEFARMLRADDVRIVADIRTVRGSRRNPQYGEAALADALPAAGFAYRPLPELGGLRHTRADTPSINGAWRNASFRAYADYMQTDAFAHGIELLIDLAREDRVALMCAEAVPWRCHRSLVGDALLVRGVEVLDIFSATSTKPHALTSFAKVDGTRVWYPPET